jgi:4'-phosphopantetheinyl transferase
MFKSKNSIYLSKIDLSLSQEKYESLMQNISKENQERCLRFRQKADALRTLYGELILRHVLNQEFSLKNENVELLRSSDGKPYVKDAPIHFNISHSGDYVVCAFSEQEIGIDIEQIKEVDLKIAERYFCSSECDDLFAQNANRRLDYFFSLWTLKESYMKWLGDGMSIPLDSFCFKITDVGISLIDANRKVKPFFKQFFIDGYKLSLCSRYNNFPEEIQKVDIRDMGF